MNDFVKRGREEIEMWKKGTLGSQKWRNWCVGREGMVLPEREEKRREEEEEKKKKERKRKRAWA